MQLTIAVLTYKRPGDLAAILPLLAEQGAMAAAPGLLVEVLVIDNDPTGSARAKVEDFARASAVPVRYQNELTPGISAARNRALDEAADSDLLVFIDDDERPGETWLPDLLATRAAHQPAAVVGPVISAYETEPEPWIQAGQFFKRRRMPTGTRLDVAATNNLLLDLRQIRAHNIRFDLDFGITGGDDTMFTRQLHRSGATMLWCDEAVVVDVVPAARLTRRWVLQRAFSSGNTWSLVSLKLAAGLRERNWERAQLSGKGSIRIAAGSARAVLGLLSASDRHQAKGLRTLARGAGMLAGAWGYRYQEYRR